MSVSIFWLEIKNLHLNLFKTDPNSILAERLFHHGDLLKHKSFLPATPSFLSCPAKGFFRDRWSKKRAGIRKLCQWPHLCLKPSAVLLRQLSCHLVLKICSSTPWCLWLKKASACSGCGGLSTVRVDSVRWFAGLQQAGQGGWEEALCCVQAWQPRRRLQKQGGTPL